MLRLIAGILLAFSACSTALALDAAHCEAVLTNGLREYNVSSINSTVIKELHKRNCGSESDIQSNSWNGGIGVEFASFGIDLTGGQKSARDQKKYFCSNYESLLSQAVAVDTYTESIVTRAYDSFDECVRIAGQGVEVSHKSSGVGIVSIYVKASVTAPVKIDGVVVSGPVSCSISGTPTTDATKIDVTSTLSIVCKRSPNENPTAANRYESADILVSTNFGPYSVTMPEVRSNLSEERAKADLRAGIARALEAYRARLETLIPSSIVYYSEGTYVHSGATGVQSVACPAGWEAISGGIGPQPNFLPFGEDRINVKKVAGGYVVDAWNRAGDHRGDQLLLAQIVCERPKFSEIPAPE